MTVRSQPRRRGLSVRLLQWLDARFAFHSVANMRAAVLAVAVICGLLSLLMGQDATWDLRNYHLYNGYAWLHGRLAQDLAAAQLQSYFSPMLDVMHSLLWQALPAPLVGFLLGAIHGLVFAPVALIAWRVLEAHPQRARLAPLLTVAGLCTAVFLSELGNSMGDNATALLVLAALALVLQAQRGAASSRGLLLWLAAGALLGLAVAFKLTNAVYALALAAATLAGPGSWWQRSRQLMVLAASALLACALVAGSWYWQVWSTFGNPLFPQFNHWFQSPLAPTVSYSDVRWLPKTVGEWLAWPLLFTAKPKRLGEVGLSQLWWAVLYLTALVVLVRGLLRRKVAAEAAFPRPLLVFFLVGYLLWQSLFSIHRYLVVLELLLPLLLWFAWQRAFAAERMRRAGGWLIGVCALSALVGGGDWGHEPWARRAFALEAPVMDAQRSVVLLVGDVPQAWRVALLPEQARYASVGSNLPASDGYRKHVAALVGERDTRYAMLDATVDKRARRVQRLNLWAGRFGVADQPDCRALRWLVAHGLRARLDDREPGCRLLPLADRMLDEGAADLATRQRAQQILAEHGLALDEASCQRRSSWIGATDFPYQWCRLVPIKAAPAPPV